MDSRARLAIGGMATAAASIAVVCAVAMTTSVALADSVGAPVGARPVIVPSFGGSTPGPARTATPLPATPPAPALNQPETVPAPEPEDVAPPAAPEASPAAAEAELIAEATASGSWDAVQEWAQEHGWSTERVDALIAQLTESRASDDAQRTDSDAQRTSGDAQRTQSQPLEPESSPAIDPRLPADLGDTSGRDLSGLSFGSKREQSRVPPG